MSTTISGWDLLSVVENLAGTLHKGDEHVAWRAFYLALRAASSPDDPDRILTLCDGYYITLGLDAQRYRLSAPLPVTAQALLALARIAYPWQTP